MDHFKATVSFGRILPPKLEDIKSYFDEQAVPAAEAEVFFFYYQSLDWHSESGMPIHNWKEAAADWLYNLKN
ncbi:hypothetical protein GCM10028791_27550 [Echinicola sediminis]